MIWLNPQTVDLGGVALSEVRQVAVDEKPEKLIVDFSDAGPHVAFADVPERRSTVKIRRRVLANETLGIAVGDERVFEMRTSATAGDGSGVIVTATVVVTSVQYRLDRHDGAEQTIEAVAVSADGSTAPVSVAADGGV